MHTWGLKWLIVAVTGDVVLSLNSPLRMFSPGEKRYSLENTWFALRIHSLPANTKIFLNYFSFAKPILHTPGTAQIGEGIENSWGDLEESEREEAAEEESESEAAAFECQTMETEDTSTMKETKKGKYLFILISDMLY